MRSRPVPTRLIVLTVASLAVFAALTVAVAGSGSLALDRRAFRIADDLRAPWLDQLAKIVTTLGLIAVVGTVVVLGAVFLARRGHVYRAAALVAGAALAWASVWLVKMIVDRSRPPDPLVHTTGKSYPSAHAANSVGWLALGIALTVVIPRKPGRVAAVSVGAVIAVLVGLSRIYLRAHFASDVVAGEALAVAMYGVARSGSLILQSRRGKPGAFT